MNGQILSKLCRLTESYELYWRQNVNRNYRIIVYFWPGQKTRRKACPAAILIKYSRVISSVKSAWNLTPFNPRVSRDIN